MSRRSIVMHGRDERYGDFYLFTEYQKNLQDVSLLEWLHHNLGKLTLLHL
jgi:hypothetical protein